MTMKVGESNELAMVKAVPDVANEDRVALMQMQIRNSLRSVLEMVPLLAKVFGRPIIPRKTVSDIVKEERDIYGFSVTEVAGQQNEEVRMVLRATGEPAVEKGGEEDLYKREEAKYLGEKLHYYLEKKDYGAARKVFKEATLRAGDNAGFMDTIMAFNGVNALNRVYQQRTSGNFAEDFMAIQGITAFSTGDFEVAGDPEICKSEEVKEKVRQLLLDVLKVHPALYMKLKWYFMSYGLMDEDLEATEAGEKIILETFLKAARKSWQVFHDEARRYEKAEMLDVGQLRRYPELMATIHRKLVSAMRKDPDFYFFLRDKWAETGIISKEEADDDPVIRRTLTYHLFIWKESCISIYGKRRDKYARAGFTEELEEGEKEFLRKRYKNSIRAIRWTWKYAKSKSIHEASYFVDLAEKKQHRDLEEMVAKEISRSMTVFNRRSEVIKALREFVEKYPQFRDVCNEMERGLNSPKVPEE